VNQSTDLVIDTEVERREAGTLITLHFASGRIEQMLLSPSEVWALKDQLETLLEGGT
jgi:hypothetical protein